MFTYYIGKNKRVKIKLLLLCRYTRSWQVSDPVTEKKKKAYNMLYYT